MTSTLVSLAEASTFLGVSRATLRNWDRAGKLNATRHPINGYRLYDLGELRGLQQQVGLFSAAPPEAEQAVGLDLRGFRRLIAKLHGILRDSDSQSNIITRFDELTKLIFAKVLSDRHRAADEDFDQDLRRYYYDLARSQAHLIPDRFSTLSCSDAALRLCSDTLGTVDLSSTSFDVQGLAYEEIIRNTFDKGDHQQFFTPPQIVDYMINLVRPYAGGSVCDPASGTGGFLAGVARSGLPYDRLVGLEIDERLRWVTGVNLTLHEARKIETHFYPDNGTLGEEADAHRSSFDLIITNPPFGSDLTDRSCLDRLILGRGRPSRRRGILFVERCFELLREGGVLAMVIDEGVLNLSHAEDVRAFILDRFDLLAVTSLPETAFMPYASVNTSILVMRKSSSAARNRRVFFARAESVGRKPNGDDDITFDADGRAGVNSDLPAAIAAWSAFSAGPAVAATENLYVADLLETLAGGGERRIDFQFHHPSRRHARAMISACGYPVRPLSEVCDERNTTVIPSQELADTFIPYTGLAQIEAHSGVAQQVPTAANAIKSAVKQYERGDVLFAKMRPNLRKVALVDFTDFGYASPECAVFTPRMDKDGQAILDPLVLAVLLRSEFVYGQIIHLVAGIGRPRIGARELRQVLLPIPPRAVQAEIRANYLLHREAARAVAAEAEALRGKAAHLAHEAVIELTAAMTRSS